VAANGVWTMTADGEGTMRGLGQLEIGQMKDVDRLIGQLFHHLGGSAGTATSVLATWRVGLGPC
jgi:hypothetical protein